MKPIFIFLLTIAAVTNASLMSMEKPRTLKEKIKEFIAPAPKQKAAALQPISSGQATDQWIEMLKHLSNLTEENIKRLIAQGADVNATQGGAKNTALIMAAANGKRQIVQLLLEAHADVNKANGGGYTPLMQAVFHEYPEILSLLVQRQANLNVQNEEGRTALMIAAARSKPELVLELIKHGAALDKNNNEGNTALMEAARNNRTDNVKILLNHRADRDLKNNFGKTALDLAQERMANQEIIDLLSAPAIQKLK